MFVLVYSVTSRKSFEEVQKIRKLIELTRSNSAIFVIIANKKDLRHLRQVPKDEGRRFAEKYSSPFFEISVAEGYHETNKVFNEMIRYILCKKAIEEGTNGKKRNNSYSSLLKGLDKQTIKQTRENKEKKHSEASLISISPAGYSS